MSWSGVYIYRASITTQQKHVYLISRAWKEKENMQRGCIDYNLLFIQKDDRENITKKVIYHSE